MGGPLASARNPRRHPAGSFGRGSWLTLGLIITALAVVGAACGGDGDEQADAALSGTIEIAGSSTVFPIAEAWAEEFGLATPGVHVNVASIGSGAGFERFCNGETDITNASRAMKASEEEICDANGVAFIEIPVAFDGLTVAVNVNNDWADYLTLDELAKIFGPADFAVTWADVRPGWPDRRISIFSPGSDSGTFDYFSDEVNGEEGVQRTDNSQFSEDDNVLVQGINGEIGAIGYFGFAYFINNQKRIRAVPIDAGAGAISPSIETIENGDLRAAVAAAVHLRHGGLAGAARGRGVPAVGADDRAHPGRRPHGGLRAAARRALRGQPGAGRGRLPDRRAHGERERRGNAGGDLRPVARRGRTGGTDGASLTGP